MALDPGLDTYSVVLFCNIIGRYNLRVPIKNYQTGTWNGLDLIKCILEHISEDFSCNRQISRSEEFH